MSETTCSVTVAPPNPRAGATPLNLLDLPADILIDILSYFQPEQTDNYGNHVGGFTTLEEARERRRDIQNARLVCRTLCRLASPRLYPVLRLPLERRSLGMIRLLLNKPAVLEGIQVVEISCLYRPKEIAESLALFVKRRLADLGEVNNRCDWIWEALTANDDNSDDDRVGEPPKEAYEEAMSNYSWMCKAWSQLVNPSDTDRNCETITKYQRLLEQGYAEYRKRHEEQVRMIADGSFVEAVATLISQIPRPCSLIFPDDAWTMSLRYHDDPTSVLTDMDELLAFLSLPHERRTLERLDGGCDLAPVTLLATLPIAVRQREATLRGLQIRCFPDTSGHFTINKQPRGNLWNDLDAACRQLKALVFTTSHKDIRHEHFQGEDKACIDRYVGATLSSPCLEYVHLSFYAFGLHDGRRGRSLVGKHRNIDIGSTISATQYPLLREARIGNISIRQHDLERFCTGLGEKLQSLHLHDIEMRGSWVGTLDILREKFATRCREGRCKITFAMFFDGEFGLRPLDKSSSWLFEQGTPKENIIDELLREPALVVRSEKYVNGDPEVTNNPLNSIL